MEGSRPLRGLPAKSGRDRASDHRTATAVSCQITLRDLAGPDPFQRLFGRRGRVELEIGCGKGRFIIRSAGSFPDVDFLAVEQAGRFFRVARQRAERRRLPNLRLIRTEALFLVRYVIPTASVDAVHVLFPDPWPKKRHHKRRLFQPDFIESVERILRGDGELNVATDHQEYFSVMQEVLGAAVHLSLMRRFALDQRLPDGEIGHTNYEVKYRRGGRPIYERTWRRRPRP
jgi:tRNA (guanine-N7-)-methyltransferase